jgi:hypothetical protein
MLLNGASPSSNANGAEENVTQHLIDVTKIFMARWRFIISTGGFETGALPWRGTFAPWPTART